MLEPSGKAVAVTPPTNGNSGDLRFYHPDAWGTSTPATGATRIASVEVVGEDGLGCAVNSLALGAPGYCEYGIRAPMYLPPGYPDLPEDSSYWGNDDNVGVAYYRDTRDNIVASVVGVYEVLGYPAVGEAGTVTVQVDFSTWATSDYALWHAPRKSSMMIGTQTTGYLYQSSNLSPTEHLSTSFSETVDLRQDRDYAWIKFQVDETWDREIYVQDTGNWNGPDSGKVAPSVEEGPDGITVEVLSMEETVYDQTIDYSFVVAVASGVVEDVEGVRYQIDAWPNGVLSRKIIPEEGGSVTYNGQITGVTEDNAKFTVIVRAVDRYGQNIYTLTQRSVSLGYVNTPASVNLSLDQWFEDEDGVWWETTIDTTSLAGATGEVCAYEYASCRATVYAVTDTGQKYAMKSMIPVQRRGDWSTTVTNIGGTILTPRDYKEVYVEIRGSSAYGVSETLESEHISVDIVPATRYTYFALGDSFASGQGIENTYTGQTDVWHVNMCRRSSFAYPEWLQSEGFFGDVDFEFWACGGAVIADVDEDEWSNEGPPWDDPLREHFDSIAVQPEGVSSLSRLDENTQVVTLSIGGNDLDWGATIGNCMGNNLKGGPWATTCKDIVVKDEEENEIGTSDEVLRERIEDIQPYLSYLYRHISIHAPNAEVFVFGYPRFFPVDGGNDGTGIAWLNRCNSLEVVDQLWLNEIIDLLDETISDTTDRFGRVHFVDTYDVGDGVEICREGIDASDQFMNGVMFTTPITSDDPPPDWGNLDAYVQPESLHPNLLGHLLLRDLFKEQAPGLLAASDSVLIESGATAVRGITAAHDAVLSVSVSWGRTPLSRLIFGSGQGLRTEVLDGGIEIQLTSPSGRVITLDSTDSNVSVTEESQFAMIEVESPEDGEWTVEFIGAHFDPEGVEASLAVATTPIPNEPPVAVIASEQSNHHISLDASDSYDPDGTVVSYEWYFGDGESATGPVVEHTFGIGNGPADATLLIRDDDGMTDMTSVKFEIPEYDFGGFTNPGGRQPLTERATAGRAIPMSFDLGQDWGNDIMMEGSPTVQQVSCTTGETIGEPQSAIGSHGWLPVYNRWTHRYMWIWYTDRDFAGTCQELVLDFNDGSTATHTVEFHRWRWNPWWRMPQSYWNWKNNHH